MNKKILNNNIVFRYREGVRILDAVTADSVKTLAVSAFSDLSPNPVVVSMQEFTSVFIPEAAVGVQLQNNMIIVNDQRIQESIGSSDEKLLLFAQSVRKKFAQPVLSYGYNFIYDIDIQDEEHIQASFAKFVNAAAPKIDDESDISVIPSVSTQVGDKRISITFSRMIDPETNKNTSRIQVAGNVHYQELQPVEELAALKDDYEECEALVSNYIDKVFQ